MSSYSIEKGKGKMATFVPVEITESPLPPKAPMALYTETPKTVNESPILMAVPRRRPLFPLLDKVVNNAITDAPFARTSLAVLATAGSIILYPTQASEALHISEALVNAIAHVPSDLWNTTRAILAK